MKRYAVAILVSLSLLVSALPIANADVAPGSKCSKVGIKHTFNGFTYTCKKSGSKLVWGNGVKTQVYTEAFAKSLLSEAKAEAAQILADAKAEAAQIASPPRCTTRNSSASVSIGTDRNTTLLSLIFENPGICDLTIRASAAFLCPDGRVQKISNYITSTGIFPLRAGEKLLVNLNLENYFPQVRNDCRLLTGYSGLPGISTFHQSPSVVTLTSNYTGNFDQVAASKRANQFLKREKARADKIVADAKNPTLIAKAWERAVEAKKAADADALAQAKAAADAAEADALAAAECPKSGRFCKIGSTGPGGGIVFYDAGRQQSWGRYLEFAPLGWSGDSSDPKTEWCDKANAPIGLPNTRTEIGSGKSNTDLMLAVCSSGAAVMARAYKGFGKNDWSLPSIDELTLLCKYWHGTVQPSSLLCGSLSPRKDLGFINREPYWSSSEYSPGVPYCQMPFSSPFGNRSTLSYVRPVRAF